MWQTCAQTIKHTHTHTHTQEQSQVLDEEQASNTSDCGENFADASKDAEANKSLDVD